MRLLISCTACSGLPPATAVHACGSVRRRFGSATHCVATCLLVFFIYMVITRLRTRFCGSSHAPLPFCTCCILPCNLFSAVLVHVYRRWFGSAYASGSAAPAAHARGFSFVSHCALHHFLHGFWFTLPPLTCRLLVDSSRLSFCKLVLFANIQRRGFCWFIFTCTCTRLRIRTRSWFMRFCHCCVTAVHFQPAVPAPAYHCGFGCHFCRSITAGFLLTQDAPAACLCISPPPFATLGSAPTCTHHATAFCYRTAPFATPGFRLRRTPYYHYLRFLSSPLAACSPRFAVLLHWFRIGFWFTTVLCLWFCFAACGFYLVLGSAVSLCCRGFSAFCCTCATLPRFVLVAFLFAVCHCAVLRGGFGSASFRLRTAACHCCVSGSLTYTPAGSLTVLPFCTATLCLLHYTGSLGSSAAPAACATAYLSFCVRLVLCAATSLVLLRRLLPPPHLPACRSPAAPPPQVACRYCTCLPHRFPLPRCSPVCLWIFSFLGSAPFSPSSALLRLPRRFCCWFYTFCRLPLSLPTWFSFTALYSAPRSFASFAVTGCCTPFSFILHCRFCLRFSSGSFSARILCAAVAAPFCRTFSFSACLAHLGSACAAALYTHALPAWFFRLLVYLCSHMVPHRGSYPLRRTYAHGFLVLYSRHQFWFATRLTALDLFYRCVLRLHTRILCLLARFFWFWHHYHTATPFSYCVIARCTSLDYSSLVLVLGCCLHGSPLPSAYLSHLTSSHTGLRTAYRAAPTCTSHCTLRFSAPLRTAVLFFGLLPAFRSFARLRSFWFTAWFTCRWIPRSLHAQLPRVLHVLAVPATCDCTPHRPCVLLGSFLLPPPGLDSPHALPATSACASLCRLDTVPFTTARTAYLP